MNVMKTTVLMAALTLLLVFAGQTLGGNDGGQFAFILALIMNMGAYWFSDKIILKIYRAREVSEVEAPGVHGIVANLVTCAKMPMPKVYLIEDPAPNAFATGRNPQHAAVAVTTGIVRLLNCEELTGVLAHEISHIRHRDILIGSIAATAAGAISMLANMAQWGMILGGGRDRSENDDRGGGLVGTLAMMIIAPMAAMLIQMAVSRSREFAADAGGARLCGNPLWLANALQKLHRASQPLANLTPATAHMFIMNPLTGRGITSLFSTHPQVEERIARLKAMTPGGGYA